MHKDVTIKIVLYTIHIVEGQCSYTGEMSDDDSRQRRVRVTMYGVVSYSYYPRSTHCYF